MNSQAIATANPLATQAAAAILRRGGSAVDAAIAAQAMLTLTEPNASGLGGGAVMLVQDAGTTFVYDGLSAAPARVTGRLEEDFDGRTIPADRAAFGGRSVGIPGVLRALEAAHARHGRLPWADLFTPAIEAAEFGYPLAPYPWRVLQENPWMRDEDFARAQFCTPSGKTVPPGTELRNPALAASLRQVAIGGAEAFYSGSLAHRIETAVAADLLPGTLIASDMAGYRAVMRTPLRFRIGRLTVLAAPLPCYGALAAAQIIGIAAACGITGMDAHPDATTLHILAEAGRLAFADRGPYQDPEAGTVDTDALLDTTYLAQRARLINTSRRRDSMAHEAPDSMTSHLSLHDGAQTVSMTTTINQNFGARMAVGGFYLNNVMTNFAARPLAGGRRAPNAMAPGLRARTTIGPCIVLDEHGQVLAALGAGGGYRIIGYIANALLRLAGGIRDPQAIVAAPQALNWNGITELEPALAEHAPALAARGHWVTTRRLDGGTQMVLRDGTSWRAGGDPRRDGTGLVLA